jgi:hypothetical protein
MGSAGLEVESVRPGEADRWPLPSVGERTPEFFLHRREKSFKPKRWAIEISRRYHHWSILEQLAYH